MDTEAQQTRHVLITGAASGIGREAALRFLRDGACVTVLFSRTVGVTTDDQPVAPLRSVPPFTTMPVEIVLKLCVICCTRSAQLALGVETCVW